MWRDLSVSTMQSPINGYQQYPTQPNNKAKWSNQPGTRNSYSLPHPAHATNQRWQHFDSRPLMHAPSYQHISVPNNHQPHQLSSRSRPVSMYDVPVNQQPYSYMNFMSLPSNHNGHNTKNGVLPRSNSTTMRQKPGELVSFSIAKVIYYAMR
jgi:hypothetical protein